MASWLKFLIIGLVGGITSGVFGIGGGVVIVPLLIYWMGFTQQRATGTSLAVLLPPIGLAAAIEYYRHGNMDLRAALIVAVAMFTGAWVGAWFANRVPAAPLRLGFGVLMIALGGYVIYGAMRTLGWV